MRGLKWIGILTSIFILTSCSGVGKRELSDLALVMAVGIDKGDKPEMVKVTAQIARPADARGQTGAPSGQTGQPILSLVGEGESIFEAIRDMSTFSTRNVFWAHNYVIVINEDLAKEGIAPIIDFFTRNPELRMRTWVVVTPEKASELVSTVTGLELVPGESINRLFRYGKLSSVVPQTQIMDVQAAFLSQSSQPVIARALLKKVEISNKKPEEGPTIKQVSLEGAGVFKEDRLVGTLKTDETRALLLFTDKMKTGSVVAPCPADPKESNAVELRDQAFKVTPHFKDGKVSFTAKLKAYASLVEAGCPFSIDNQDDVRKMEKSIEGQLKKDTQKAIEKIQKEYKSDVLELGKVFQNEYPGEWKEISMKWGGMFPEVAIDLSVDVEIKQSALLWEPTNSGKKEISAD